MYKPCTNHVHSEDHRTSNEDQVAASLDLCSLHPHRCCRQFPRWLRGWPRSSLRRSEDLGGHGAPKFGIAGTASFRNYRHSRHRTWNMHLSNSVRKRFGVWRLWRFVANGFASLHTGPISYEYIMKIGHLMGIGVCIHRYARVC